MILTFEDRPSDSRLVESSEIGRTPGEIRGRTTQSSFLDKTPARR